VELSAGGGGHDNLLAEESALRPRILPRSLRAAPSPEAAARAYDRHMANAEPTGTLLTAVEHLEKGEWQPAHEIVQGQRSNLAAWLHGIVHTLEGDLDNARYWYRRAGRDFPGAEAVQREIAAARRRVTR
jgi:hypothetical protein